MREEKGDILDFSTHFESDMEDVYQ